MAPTDRDPVIAPPRSAARKSERDAQLLSIDFDAARRSVPRGFARISAAHGFNGLHRDTICAFARKIPGVRDDPSRKIARIFTRLFGSDLDRFNVVGNRVAATRIAHGKMTSSPSHPGKRRASCASRIAAIASGLSFAPVGNVTAVGCASVRSAFALQQHDAELRRVTPFDQILAQKRARTSRQLARRRSTVARRSRASRLRERCSSRRRESLRPQPIPSSARPANHSSP